MDKKELYLKTIFSCMVCDGSIATEEIGLVRELANSSELFMDFDVEKHLNAYITEINENGTRFLSRYLSELADAELDKELQMNIVNLSLKTIEADNVIAYSEVKFFKKIRSRLSLTDDEILECHPDKGDFLLPDVDANEEPALDGISFGPIDLKL